MRPFDSLFFATLTEILKKGLLGGNVFVYKQGRSSDANSKATFILNDGYQVVVAQLCADLGFQVKPNGDGEYVAAQIWQVLESAEAFRRLLGQK